MKKTIAAILAAAIALILGTGTAHAKWTDIPTGLTSSPNADGTYRLDLSWGIGDPVGDGQTTTLYRKAGKKWVKVPSRAASERTPLQGVGNHSVVYPRADKFVPGQYLIAFTENSRAQWDCSIYYKEVCRWVGASSFSTLFRFRWTGTALEPGTQVNFAFK
jgi:hypothetical protein